jgi:hypothetical protein
MKKSYRGPSIKARQFLFLIGWFIKIFSKTALPNKSKFDKKLLWKVLYKISSFHPDW